MVRGDVVLWGDICDFGWGVGKNASAFGGPMTRAEGVHDSHR